MGWVKGVGVIDILLETRSFGVKFKNLLYNLYYSKVNGVGVGYFSPWGVLG